jgi:hypothetical protein
MNDYASAVALTGQAYRNLGDEPAACAQFSKSKDLYLQNGFSLSNAGEVQRANLEKALATCAH